MTAPALSSTALAELEKLCEAAPVEARRLQRYASSATGGSYAEKCAVLSEELNAFGNTLNRLRNAFPSLAAKLRASEARIGELENCIREGVALVEKYDPDKAIEERDAALAEVERLKGGHFDPSKHMRTCAKCGSTAVAFVCSKKGCPENGGAAYHVAARPSTPAPDRGVPGQRVSDELARLYAGILDPAPEDDPLTPWERRARDLALDLIDARAAQPALPEWRDAIEAAAKVVERYVVAHHGAGQKYLQERLEGDVSNLAYAAAIRALPPPSTTASPWRDAPPLTFTYRNYRGETAERRVQPIAVRFGSTCWHPEPQWLLRAFDLDRQAEREFAMSDMAPPSTPATEAVARR